MSTSKLDSSGVFRVSPLPKDSGPLLLTTAQVAFRRNGIEFLSPEPIPLWKELTVDLRSKGGSCYLRGTGVVVDCAGSRHAGYVVSLMFMGLTRQSQEQLSQMAAFGPV